MMLLFLSPENPLWQMLLEATDKKIQTKISKYVGISRQTITNWRKGGTIGSDESEPLDDRVFRKIKERLEGGASDPDFGRVRLNDDQKVEAKKIVDRFEYIYRNNVRYKVYDAARALNIPIQKCQEVIDDAIYACYPAFPEMYYTDDSKSQRSLKSDFELYCGVYDLWVKRTHNNKKLWLRCPLRVRYAIRIGEGTAIRCKLNFPILEPQSERPYWQYDGFLTVRDQSLFWNFEKRGTAGTWIDYFNFITSCGRNWPNGKGPLTAVGAYLTTGQDKARSIVADYVLLQKQTFEFSNEDKVIAFMHGRAACVDTKKKREQLDRLIVNFRSAVEINL
jgi:hypothetical protein